VEIFFQVECGFFKEGCDFSWREISSVSDFSGRNPTPYFIGTRVFGEYGSCAKHKTVRQDGRLIEDNSVFMNPYILAQVFVLPENSMTFLGGKQWFVTLMTMVVGINPCPGTYHTPWSNVDVAGVVQNGKTADDHICLAPGGIKDFRGKDKFSFVNIGVWSAAAFFERYFQFRPGL